MVWLSTSLLVPLGTVTPPVANNVWSSVIWFESFKLRFCSLAFRSLRLDSSSTWGFRLFFDDVLSFVGCEWGPFLLSSGAAPGLLLILWGWASWSKCLWPALALALPTRLSFLDGTGACAFRSSDIILTEVVAAGTVYSARSVARSIKAELLLLFFR